MTTKKLLASTAPLVLAKLVGCGGSVGVQEPVAVNSQTGAVTSTTTVSGQITWGGAKPQVVGGSSLSSYTIVQSVPSALYTSSTSAPQVTLTATTDTGYVSSITLSLASTTTWVSPVNSGDVVYAWTIPQTAQFETWQQQVSANSSAEAEITGVSNATFVAAQPGTYQLTSIVQTPSSSASASTTISVPTPRCAGGCPIREQPGA